MSLRRFSELALKWHTLSYIVCSECSTGATTVTELTELSSPGGESPCFDFGGAIIQFSISGSNYQSFLNPPSWAAQLTIITMRIKVIVICCIWNFFWKKQGLASKGVFLKGFCLEEIEMSYNSEWGEEEMEDEERWIPQNEEDGIFKMRKRDGRWNWTSIISGDWPDWQDGSQQSVSDSISLFPYFVIVQPSLLAPLYSKYLLHILTVKPPRYGVTLKQLRELMESRGYDGVQKVTNSYFPNISQYFSIATINSA